MSKMPVCGIVFYSCPDTVKGAILGKLDCFSIQGLELFFYSNDHLPPHFHVKKVGEWEVRINIETSTEANGLDLSYVFPKRQGRNFRGISGQQQRQILKLIVDHRLEILEEWNLKVLVQENI